jgi:DNA-binding CsgD family transcriptional regulator
LNGLALLYEHVGDMERAIVPTQEALALAREVCDRVGEGHALVELGNIARIAGEYERAIPLIEEGLAIFRILDDRNGIRVALRVLGDTRYLAGDGERARALLEESLALVKSMGFSWGVAVTLRLLGIVAHGQGDLDRAMALLEESLAVFAPLRVMHGPHYARCELGHVVLARGDPRRASACFTESLEVSREVGDQRGVVRCLEGLAGIAAATVDGESDTEPIRAARLLGASAALRETLGIPVTPIERSTVERASAAVRANVGEDAYAEAWAGGWALPLDEAIELALATAASQSSSATIDDSASRPRSTSPLTPREVEVASLVARGLTNRQTAAELVISERTVDGHVASILSKLGFATRAQIAAWAVQRGIVTPIEPE